MMMMNERNKNVGRLAGLMKQYIFKSPTKLSVVAHTRKKKVKNLFLTLLCPLDLYVHL